jgi:hypothetical protein
MARAQATTDHEVIRHWIETHKGHPSVVRATEGTRAGSAGLLRVDFEPAEDSLEEIGWDDFFTTFDSNNLAFLYQDEKQSRFHKFVSRNSVESSGESAGKTRQASSAEQEEAEEIDEEDLDEEDLDDEDLDEEDLDEEDLDEEDLDEDEDAEDDDEKRP